MAEADDLHGAAQDRRVSRGVVTPIGQTSGDLFIGFSPAAPSPGSISSISRPAERSDQEPTVTAMSASVVSPPFQTTRQWTRSGAMRSDDDLVDQAPQQRLLLLAGEAIGPPPLRDPLARPP